MKKRKNSKGFSLIELIIAIAILVILTGLLAPQFMRYMEKSREAKDMQVLDTIYGAVQVALTNEDAYAAVTSDSTNNNAIKNLKSKGVSLAELLFENGDKNALLAFKREFCLTMGISGDPINSLKFSPWVSKAVMDANVIKDKPDKDFPLFGTAVYIQIDKDMKVTVWIGKAATEKIDDKGKKEYPVTDTDVLNSTTAVSGLNGILTAGTKFIISK
ncbi:MAG: prepilin-type N-terminal cleavage/methylation domain-containing protein [Clostridium sp.]